MKKYEFTGETLEHRGRTLHRIRRISDGFVGGWIESEDNLSHEGDCFVYGEAKVYGNAKVHGNARVYGEAKVFNNAEIYGNARVFENAEISGSARVYGEAKVYENVWAYGTAEVFGKAIVAGNTNVFAIDRATELIDKVNDKYTLFLEKTLLDSGFTQEWLDKKKSEL